MKLIFIPAFLVLLFSCSSSTSKIPSKTEPVMVKSSSGLQYAVAVHGRGEQAKEGDKVLIFETTTYRDGTVLYSNEHSDNPIPVLIGGNQVIEGVDEGLRGMREKEVRKLIVPPHLAIRSEYPDHISPDSTLLIKLILDKIVMNSDRENGG